MQAVVFVEKFEHGVEVLHDAVTVIEIGLPIEVALDMLAQTDQAHGVEVEAAEGVLVVESLVVSLEKETF